MTSVVTEPPPSRSGTVRPRATVRGPRYGGTEAVDGIGVVMEPVSVGGFHDHDIRSTDRGW